MSKLCQNVLPIAKKQIKTKIRTNKQKKPAKASSQMRSLVQTVLNPTRI